MSTTLSDRLIVQVSGFGPGMTARQSIQRAKKIMLDLETISPWRRPFEVSGCTKETGDMPIAGDLSDFDEVVMRALQSYDDVRYYNENDPDNWRLTLIRSLHMDLEKPLQMPGQQENTKTVLMSAFKLLV